MDLKKQLQEIVEMSSFRQRIVSCRYISADIQYNGIDVIDSEKVERISEKIKRFDAKFYLLKKEFDPVFFATKELNKAHRQYSFDIAEESIFAIAEEKMVQKDTLAEILSNRLEFTPAEMEEDSIISVYLRYDGFSKKLRIGVGIYTLNKNSKKIDKEETPFKESLFIFNSKDALNGWIFRTCYACTYFSEPAEDQQCESDKARAYFFPRKKPTQKSVSLPFPMDGRTSMRITVPPYLPADLNGSETANYCPYFKTSK